MDSNMKSVLRSYVEKCGDGKQKKKLENFAFNAGCCIKFIDINNNLGHHRQRTGKISPSQLILKRRARFLSTHNNKIEKQNKVVGKFNGSGS
jgi:hypothetical protein